VSARVEIAQRGAGHRPLDQLAAGFSFLLMGVGSLVTVW
jgi:hypothetical protein